MKFKLSFKLFRIEVIELLFVIYLTSGLIKSYINVFNINLPIDFTILTTLILIFAMIAKRNFRFTSNIAQYQPIIIISIFFMVIIISLSYTSSKIYSISKTFLFLTNIIPIVLLSISRNFNVNKFLKYFIILTLLYFIFYLPILILSLNSQINLMQNLNLLAGSLYLTIGEMLGASIIIIISNKNVFGDKKIDIIFLFLSILALIQTGARGPILAVIIVLLIYGIKKYFIRQKLNIKKSYIKIIIIFLALILILYFKVPEIKITIDRTIARSSLLINGLREGSGLGDSGDSRIKMYYDSFNIMKKLGWRVIIGSGIGSYGVEAYGIDFRAYPHNVLLEIFLELGGVGFIIFICFLIVSLATGKGKYGTMGYILLYMLINVMKSSSLVDIRTIFMFIMIQWYQKNIIPISKQFIYNNNDRGESKIL